MKLTGLLAAFYEKCGFSKKENEMVSVESSYQNCFLRSATGQIRE